MKWFCFFLVITFAPGVWGWNDSGKAEERSETVAQTAKKDGKTLTLVFHNAGEYHYKLVLDNIIIDRTDLIEQDGDHRTVELEEGVYHILGHGLLSQGEHAGRLFLMGRELLDMSEDRTVAFSAANAVAPTLHVTNQEGVRKPISQIENRTFIASLVHIHENDWITARTTAQAMSGPLPLVAANVNGSFHFEVVGLAALEGKDIQFAEFGLRFHGGDATTHFENDWRSHKSVTFQRQAVGHPDTLISPQYQALAPTGAVVTFNTDVLVPNRRVQAPFQMTVLAMPQDLGFGYYFEYRLAMRRFRVEETPLGLEDIRVVESEAVKIKNHQEMAFMHMHPNFPEERYVTESDILFAGGDLIWPNFFFFSSYITYSLGLHPSVGTGLFKDAWQNSTPQPPLGFTLKNEDTGVTELEGDHNALAHMTGQSIFSIGENRYTFSLSYQNLFNGQPVESWYRALIHVRDGDDAPPWLHQFYVEQDGMRNSVVTGPAGLVMELDDFRRVASAEVNVGVANDLIPVNLNREGNRFTGQLPEATPGTYMDLHVAARDEGGHSFDLLMKDALRSGYFHLIPWVVNNWQWSTRIVMVNTGAEPVEVWLEALTANGRPRVKIIQVPAKGVFAAQAEELYPGLTRYRLKINTLSKDLYPSFLTINLEADSGGQSPSQTTALFSEELSSRLLFPYLPGDQIPAIVLSAPDMDQESNGTAPVRLTLLDGENGVVAQKNLELFKTEPKAFLVKDLFENVALPQHGALEVTAGEGHHLAGTTFTFNHYREPSMAAAVVRPHEPANGQIIPWVVNNPQWSSRLTLYNGDDQTRVVTFQATPTEGLPVSATREMEPNGVAVWEAGDLFPNLSGYSLTLDTEPQARIFSSFLTFNREPQSGGMSPSQTTGVLPHEQGPGLVFGYLPADQISAVVLTAPKGEGATVVHLTAMGPEGVLAETQATLTDNRPLAVLVTDLFPDTVFPRDMAIHAVSGNGADLAGTAFIFNNQREPSMAKPYRVRN